ncbi:MAG: hypothetical protein N3F09_10175 [Bacteroidia bacterium]|nr:hypothetical protein [Bacteroidia bacterium]
MKHRLKKLHPDEFNEVVVIDNLSNLRESLMGYTKSVMRALNFYKMHLYDRWENYFTDDIYDNDLFYVFEKLCQEILQSDIILDEALYNHYPKNVRRLIKHIQTEDRELLKAFINYSKDKFQEDYRINCMDEVLYEAGMIFWPIEKIKKGILTGEIGFEQMDFTLIRRIKYYSHPHKLSKKLRGIIENFISYYREASKIKMSEKEIKNNENDFTEDPMWEALNDPSSFLDIDDLSDSDLREALGDW